MFIAVDVVRDISLEVSHVKPIETTDVSYEWICQYCLYV